VFRGYDGASGQSGRSLSRLLRPSPDRAVAHSPQIPLALDDLQHLAASRRHRELSGAPRLSGWVLQVVDSPPKDGWIVAGRAQHLLVALVAEQAPYAPGLVVVIDREAAGAGLSETDGTRAALVGQELEVILAREAEGLADAAQPR